MRRYDAVRRRGGRRKLLPVFGQRLRQQIGVTCREIWPAHEHMAAERDDDPQRRLGISANGGLARNNASALSVCMIATSCWSVAMSTPMRREFGGADQLRARTGQIARQHLDHRRGQGTALVIVTLADDQEMIAPVDRPHAVRVEVGKPRPERGRRFAGTS